VDRRLLRIALALALASPATAAGAHAELPPPAAGLPGGTVDPALDTTPPQLALDGRRAQPLSPVLEAYATCSERCQFDASARVRGVPSLDFLRVVTPTKASEGGRRLRFELRVSPRADRLIEAALRAGRRVRVKVAVTAYDLAGNDTSHSLRIRVLPQT
jgi:hypothetical protein